ncbi:MAG TPA: hypothetical protein PLJ29_04700, partial [Leptospiraceae bacterium]|nr:hypothetical protein [Leptospiraceae bacterium]
YYYQRSAFCAFFKNGQIHIRSVSSFIIIRYVRISVEEKARHIFEFGKICGKDILYFILCRNILYVSE